MCIASGGRRIVVKKVWRCEPTARQYSNLSCTSRTAADDDDGKERQRVTSRKLSALDELEAALSPGHCPPVFRGDRGRIDSLVKN